MIKKMILFITLLIAFSTTAFAADTSEESTIQPRESSVISEVSSAISRTGYSGTCTLMEVGSGAITITLQKKNSSGEWENVAGSSTTKTFSNTMLASHSKSKTLSSGTYRCKTYVTATVNGKTDGRFVYSPVLTLN